MLEEELGKTELGVIARSSCQLVRRCMKSAEWKSEPVRGLSSSRRPETEKKQTGLEPQTGARASEALDGSRGQAFSLFYYRLTANI